jgi:DNA-binding LacI/PurR family transcriptional regulator
MIRCVNANNGSGSGTRANGRAGGRDRARSAVMSDVAALAGVSHQTVSRVLNGSASVREETRARVLEAMRKLDYRPNLSARALVTGRSRTLGVVTFDTALYGPASTLVGVERAAHAEGWFVSVVSLDSLERSAVAPVIERLRALPAAGILIIAPQLASARALWDLPDDVPVVAVETGPEEGIAVVAVDQREGARMATQHLLDLGHRTVRHLAGPPDWLEAEQRIEGWRAALEAVGARSDRPLRGDWGPRSGYELGRQLAGVGDLTAVFVANDQMALGLLRALREHGRDVPGDVSVVGFDDVPEAEFFSPPLTTIRQDFAEVGRRGLHLLLAQIAAGRRSTTRSTVGPELVRRVSAGPPRADAAS